MAKNSVTVDVDWMRVGRRLDDGVGKMQGLLDDQVIKDTDSYVPMDAGTLKDSPARARKDGEVVYATPYAVRQYYGGGNKSRDRHPNATSHWFEAAKAVYKGAWERVKNRVRWDR